MKEKRYPEVVLLHIVGCGMILICHFFQNAKIGALGEFFLAGLSLFFLISGFLAGLKEKFDSKWIVRRFFRVLKPYYAVIIIATVIYYFFASQEFNWSSQLYLFTCTQGINYIYWPFEGYQAMAGFGHLWYITVFLVCVVFTPFLNMLYQRSNRVFSSHFLAILFILFVLQPVAIFLGFQFSYIFTYIIGFVISRQKIEFNKRNLLSVFIFFIFTCLVRLLGRMYIDGTVFYDRYIALVSQMSLALVIFFAVFYVGSLRPVLISEIASTKSVLFLSSITYEIYLVHYFFLRGAWPMQSFIKNTIIADSVVVLLTLLSSYTLNRLQKHKLFQNENLHRS